MRRRAFLTSLTLVAGAGLLAACGAPAAPQAPQAQPQQPAPQAQQAQPQTAQVQPTQLAQGQPRSGSQLRVGILGDIPSLDPHQLTPPVPDVTFGIWDRLLTYDAQVKPVGILADSWEMSSDGKQL